MSKEIEKPKRIGAKNWIDGIRLNGTKPNEIMKNEPTTKQEIFEEETKERLKTPFGRIDNYLLESEKYTQEERELIMNFLFGHSILLYLDLEIVTTR